MDSQKNSHQESLFGSEPQSPQTDGTSLSIDERAALIAQSADGRDPYAEQEAREKAIVAHRGEALGKEQTGRISQSVDEEEPSSSGSEPEAQSATTPREVVELPQRGRSNWPSEMDARREASEVRAKMTPAQRERQVRINRDGAAAARSLLGRLQQRDK